MKYHEVTAIIDQLSKRGHVYEMPYGDALLMQDAAKALRILLNEREDAIRATRKQGLDVPSMYGVDSSADGSTK